MVTGDHGSANVGGQDVRYHKESYVTAKEAAENAAAFYKTREQSRRRDKDEGEGKEDPASELSDSGVDSDQEEEYEYDERENPKSGLLLKGERYYPDCFLMELSLEKIKADSSALAKVRRERLEFGGLVGSLGALTRYLSTVSFGQVTGHVYGVADICTDEGQCHSPDASWSNEGSQLLPLLLSPSPPNHF